MRGSHAEVCIMRGEINDDFPLVAPRRYSFGRSGADVRPRASSDIDLLLKTGAGLSVAVLIGVLGHLWLTGLGFGSDVLALRHVAAGAGCRVAGAVGLAQAQRGQAGYWARLDGNGNGLTCESYDPAA